MAKFHRTTITVPVELKARMDAVDGQANWSRIACLAFEREIERIEREKAKKASETKAALLARLRANAGKEGSRPYEGGRRAGEEWATEEASGTQLEAIHAFRQEMQQKHGDLKNWIEIDKPPPLNNLRIIGLVILGAPEGMWPKFVAESDDYMSMIYGHRSYFTGSTRKGVAMVEDNDEARTKWNENEDLRGFIDGAADLWEEVKDKL